MNDRTVVVASFKYKDDLLRAIRRVQEQLPERWEVYSPYPDHDLEHHTAGKPSPVRYYTLTGSIMGLVGGLGLAIWSSLKWGLISGGKPVVSIPPFIVVGFEMTILFGALATLVGLVVTQVSKARGVPGAYNPRFSRDRFGLAVRVRKARVEEFRRVFSETGAEEIHVR